MKKRRFAAPALLVILVVLTLPATVHGAEPPSLAPGMRVRVTRQAAQDTTIGRILTLDAFSLTLLSENPPRDSLEILRSSIDRLEVSRGFRGHALLGGAVGMVLGVAGAALLAGDNSELGPAYAALVTGSMGAIAGTLVGSGIRTERWATIPQAR